MQFQVVFLLIFGIFSYTDSAPREGLPLLNPGGIGGIFEGPDSQTIIQGPDGSEITSEQKGGAIIRDDGLEAEPIIVAEPQLLHEALVLNEERIVSAGPIISSSGSSILAPVDEASQGQILASQSTQLLTGETYAAPVENIITGYEEEPLVGTGPIVEANPIDIVQQDPHIIETEIIDAPDIEPDQSSDLQGPSGRVITKGSASIVSGPASTTITEPRRIIVAPTKIAINNPVIAQSTVALNQVLLAETLPTLREPIPAIKDSLSAVALSQGTYEGSSTLAPPALSYSTTVAPVEYGYSTIITPLVEKSGIEREQSTRIDLGVNNVRQSIPVVEYSSSNGVINEPALLNGESYSSTQLPILSSNTGTIATGPVFPPTYIASSLVTHSLFPRAAGLVPSSPSPYIQKIPRIGDSVSVDGRVDMGYPSYQKRYQLPRVLGRALSQFYQKTPTETTDRITIDDKMGDLSQNEITSYDTRRQYIGPPDLLQSEYIAPALARNGISAAQVNLAQVPLSQVTRFADDAYQRRYDIGYQENK